MKKKRTLEERYRRLRIDCTMLMILIILYAIGFLFLAGAAVYYDWLYQEAIRQGAENTVTAIQMTSACIRLGNFTYEEIIRETIEMFVLESLPEKTTN